MRISPTNLFSADNDSWSVFINIPDNRIVFKLYACTYNDICEIRDNFSIMINKLKPGFTVLTDLSEFTSDDPYVSEAVADVQKLLSDHGAAETVRIKTATCSIERLKNNMSDGFFTNFSAGINHLNEWRRMYGIS